MVILVLIKKECNDMYQIVFGMHADLTIDSEDDPEGNSEIVSVDEQHAQ